MTAQWHVLVADDLADNRNLLEQLLEESYVVTTAVNGRDALDQIRRRRPDLVLLDLMMPVMDGFGVLQVLADEDGPFLPVLVISALNDREARLRALSLGAHDFITKPFDQEELRLRVGTALALKAARMAAETRADELESLVRERTRALAEREHWFRSVFEHAGIGMAVVDGLGALQRGNRALAAMFGLTEGELAKLHVGEATCPEDWASERPLFEEIAAGTRDRYQLEKRFVRMDGSQFWARVTASLLPTFEAGGVLLMVEDVSARKLAEERFGSFMYHIPAVAWVKDGEGRFTFVNPKFEEKFGVKADDLIGKTDRVFLAEPHSRLVAESDRRVRDSGKPLEVIETVPAADGAPHHWLVVKFPCAPMVGAGATGGVAIDITARIQAEYELRLRKDELEKANDELQRLDRLKDDFLSIVSHELRTPINAITGFGSILQDEIAGPLSEEQHEFLAKLMIGADHLLSVVNDLLDMSRIQAGKFQLDPAPIALPSIILQALATLKPLAETKGISLGCELPDDLPLVVADGQRIHQVLLNLINNAIKFTERGSIVVRAARTPDGLCCEVEDTGSGIVAEDLPKLFQRFGQLDSSSTRTAGGVGLGLAISKALVEAHGGEIGVRSVPQQGSCFYFVLPIRETDPESDGRTSRHS